MENLNDLDNFNSVTPTSEVIFNFESNYGDNDVWIRELEQMIDEEEELPLQNSSLKEKELSQFLAGPYSSVLHNNNLSDVGEDQVESNDRMDESIRTDSTYFTYKHMKIQCNVDEETTAPATIADSSPSERVTGIPSPKMISQLPEELYIKEIYNIYSQKLKNPFDVSFLVIQTSILRSHKNHPHLSKLLKSAFIEIINGSLPYIQKSLTNFIDFQYIEMASKRRQLHKEANLRQRCKSLYQKLMIKLVNTLLMIVTIDTGEIYELKTMNFKDPHRKNNLNKIDKPLIELITSENPSNRFISSLINAITHGKVVQLGNGYLLLVFQLLYSILQSSYKDSFNQFFSSVMYENVILKNISKRYGQDFGAEFNYHAKTFVEYVNGQP